MKLCFVMTDVFSYGGIERVSRILVSALSERYQLEVVSIFSTPREGEVLALECPVIQLEKERKPLKEIFLRSVVRLRKLVKKEKFDVVIATSEALAPICAAAILGLKTQLISWFHCGPDISDEYSFQKYCRSIAVKCSAKRVVLSPVMQEDFEKAYPRYSFTPIPNPIEERLMAPVSYDENSRKIITVGRVCAQKNYFGLVDIANLVLERNPAWEWDIYGDGELFEQLKEYVRENGIQDRLHLKGYCSEMYRQYSRYAFQVMTSRYEGFPMTLLEGMANGMPLIAYDVKAGPRYVIRDGENGYLIEFEDKNAMAQRIQDLIDDSQTRKRMSAASMEFRLSFGISDVVKKWSVLLEHDI